MRVTIGGRELITSTTLLVPGGEDAWIEFDADNWRVRLNLLFIDDASNAEGAVKVEPKDDYAVLKFLNWKNMLPGVTPVVDFGETNGRKVSIAVSGYAVSDSHCVTISFFWGKANGG